MRKFPVAIVLAAALLVGAVPAQADPHDHHRSGHPLRIAAHLLHPVGYLVDLLLFRPAHWVVNHDPFHVFGHEH